MVKSETEKPWVDPPVERPPEGFHCVGSLPEPLVTGTAHTTFKVDAAPDAEVIVCLEGGRMVGLVVRGEVTTRALHRIPLRALERYALRSIRRVLYIYDNDPFLAERRNTVNNHLGRPYFEAYEKAVTVAELPSTTRENYLASLAARYLELCSRTGSPTKELAEELHLSVATVRDQLGDARRRGLLLAAGAGRAGGELTPKAQALLSTDEEG